MTFQPLDRYNAFLHRDEREPVESSGRLSGLTVAVKDNIHVKDMPLTCGSRILDGYTAPFDATIVARLRSAGAWITGKTNLDEFGFGSSGEHSAFGATKNPVCDGMVPGGSSSGSAAAVAGGLTDTALGSDTGGSVRQPAAFCGLVGFCPSWGRLSRYGLTAFASSLDRIGLLARDLETVRRLFAIVDGPDPLDATSLTAHERNYKSDGTRSGRPVIGFSESWNRTAQPEIGEALRCFLDGLRAAGYPVRPVSLPNPDDVLAVYHVIAASEAMSNLQRFDGLRYGRRADDIVTARSEGFGREVKRRLLMGAWCTSEGLGDDRYRAAAIGRHAISRRMDSIFADVDLVVTPTTPTTAFPLGERARPTQMYRSDRFTVTASLAGIPALSMPWGTDRDGKPVGIQLMAGRFNEKILLDMGAVLEQVRAKG